MKDIIIVVIISFLLFKAYESYEKKHAQIPNNLSNTGYNISESRPNNAPLSVSFKCDGRTHCSQMSSCDEALFFLQNCPIVKWMATTMVSLARNNGVIDLQVKEI